VTPGATSITTVAEAFFEACEKGQGWAVCSRYCTPNASFSAQAEPLLDLKKLAQYTDWMKGMLTVLPDAHGQRPEQRRRLWGVLRDPYRSGRACSPNGAQDQYGLRLCDAIRRRQNRAYDKDMERGACAERPRLGVGNRVTITVMNTVCFLDGRPRQALSFLRQTGATPRCKTLIILIPKRNGFIPS
jgi:hypothetical protein